jgi:hypothetical protein
MGGARCAGTDGGWAGESFEQPSRAGLALGAGFGAMPRVSAGRRGQRMRGAAIADMTPHALAAHVRVDPRGLRRPAAARDVPARAHRSDAHARRLPAGPRPRPGSGPILEHVMGCTLAEGRAILNGERLPAGVLQTNYKPGTKKPPRRAMPARRRRRETDGLTGTSPRADEGTRTLDLLHGKQERGRCGERFLPAIRYVPGGLTVRVVPADRRRFRGVLGTNS